MIGKQLELPLTGRTIPVIADAYVEAGFGSGAVKITPAHDFNDYEMGQRHKLPQINIFTPNARLNDNAPEKYRGLDRVIARKQIVAELEELGLIEKIEPHKLKVPRGDRTNAVIEPYLTDQWYVKIAPLAEPRSRPWKTAARNSCPRLVEDLLRVDAQHQGLVRQPPALVGSSHSGLV